MSLIINDASLLNYTYETKFFGEYRFGYIQNYTVEGVILQTGVYDFSGNTRNNLSYINVYSSGFKQDQEIIVNGKNFGTGRILSLTNTNDFNPATAATRYNLSFEIYNSGRNDLSGLSIKNTIIDPHLIEDFSENFDFNIGNDGFRNSSHDISVKYRDLSAGEINPNSSSGVITKSKRLASGIFDLALDFTFLNSVFDDLKITTAKKYYKESYDLINHKCSFGESFKISKDTGIASVDHTYQNSFILSPEGIIQISEQGKVQGLGQTQEICYLNASGSLNSIINGSSLRCTGMFFDYKNSNSLNLDLYEDLNTGNYISLTKNHNPFEGSIEYNITYTNDKKYINSGYSHQYENLYSKDNTDLVNIQRNGTLKRISQDRNKNFNELTGLIEKIDNSFNTAPDQLNTFYANLSGSGNLYLLNKTINYPIYGNEMTYGINYSDDRSLNVFSGLSGYFNKFDITINDKAPAHMYNEYIIPNVKTLLSAGGQTLLGQRTMSIEGILKRNTQNANFGTNLLSGNFLNDIKYYLASKLISNLNQKSAQIREMFLENCNYTIDSDFKFSLNLDVSYTSYVVEFNSGQVMLSTGDLT